MKQAKPKYIIKTYPCGNVPPEYQERIDRAEKRLMQNFLQSMFDERGTPKQMNDAMLDDLENPVVYGLTKEAFESIIRTNFVEGCRPIYERVDYDKEAE